MLYSNPLWRNTRIYGNRNIIYSILMVSTLYNTELFIIIKKIHGNTFENKDMSLQNIVRSYWKRGEKDSESDFFSKD